MPSLIFRERLAVAERNSEYTIIDEQTTTGNLMKFCLALWRRNEDMVRKAYEILKTDANYPYS